MPLPSAVSRGCVPPTQPLSSHLRHLCLQEVSPIHAIAFFLCPDKPGPIFLRSLAPVHRKGPLICVLTHPPSAAPRGERPSLTRALSPSLQVPPFVGPSSWVSLASLLSSPCPDASLPLRSQEVSNPHSVAFFPCPDRFPGLCGPSLSVPHVRSHYFRINERSLALLPRCVGPMPGLAMRWPYRVPPPPAPSYAPGPNASGAATVALSAPLADPTPAVPSAMASAAPTAGNAPPHPCASTPKGSHSLASMSTFTTVPASPRGSETQETQVRWPLRMTHPSHPTF